MNYDINLNDVYKDMLLSNANNDHASLLLSFIPRAFGNLLASVALVNNPNAKNIFILA